MSLLRLAKSCTARSAACARRKRLSLLDRTTLWITVVAATLATAVALAAEPVILRRPPPLGPGIAALPRIAASPGDRAAAPINRALADDDDDARAAAVDCRQTGKKRSDFSRSVVVTMRGPAYLGITETRSWYCGGPYPDWSTTPFVFDLTTGARVDWQKLLPAGLVDKTVDGDDPAERLIVSSKLTALYVAAQSDKECRDVLSNWNGGLGFALWPDAAGDGIAIEANNLPHVVKACGPDQTIAMPELRKLGVDDALLGAIEEAHRHGWYDKPATPGR